ncbi:MULTISPECIES: helix-turn-helix domain-containing protein [unclassified Nostoc]|uniref:helix-turn-helix domain-containing protein n=1 Tax=unclassified Nostoc TaxID=2593658 RepID=UPI00260D679C|nr:helix-turn-helix domain-containing protein [Nostoc sp. S13]MDF5734491.1 helix-turn-helix domain-containing protein [Nostoc sp. S13]
MKARYEYRFYPTDQQLHSLAQLFGLSGMMLCQSINNLKNYPDIISFHQCSLCRKRQMSDNG